MLLEWEKRISRGGGWKMKPHHTVCEMHFEKKYLKEEHDLGIGTESRKRKALTADAIPTIFEGYPSYMNSTTTKRKSPKKRGTPVEPKRRKKSIDASTGEIQNLR